MPPSSAHYSLLWSIQHPLPASLQINHPILALSTPTTNDTLGRWSTNNAVTRLPPASTNHPLSFPLCEERLPFSSPPLLRGPFFPPLPPLLLPNLIEVEQTSAFSNTLLLNDGCCW